MCRHRMVPRVPGAPSHRPVDQRCPRRPRSRAIRCHRLVQRRTDPTWAVSMSPRRRAPVYPFLRSNLVRVFPLQASQPNDFFTWPAWVVPSSTAPLRLQWRYRTEPSPIPLACCVGCIDGGDPDRGADTCGESVGSGTGPDGAGVGVGTAGSGAADTGSGRAGAGTDGAGVGIGTAGSGAADTGSGRTGAGTDGTGVGIGTVGTGAADTAGEGTDAGTREVARVGAGADGFALMPEAL